MSGDERPTDGPGSDWVPGDPVYPEQQSVPRRHCGPCLVAWTAEAERCPECGELCTEALRKLAATARSVVDLMDRTSDMPGAVRDVVENLRDALSGALSDDATAPDGRS